MSASIFTFFGLRENPFSIGPDPRFLILHPAAQAAWDDLLYAVRNRKGLILLTGEIGTGKTTLLRALIDWLRSHKSPSTLIVNSHLEGADLLDVVLSGFSILSPTPQPTDKLQAFHRWLLQRYDARQLPVLILDEAQGLLPRVLEEIRLLLNLETSSDKLLQIVLAGQPELDEKLRGPEFAPIRQRIAARCRTAPLKLDQTRQYVAERLGLAGASNISDIFAPETLDAIHHFSRGAPRVINLLCEHALINGYADRRTPIPPGSIADVAREFHCDPARPGAPHRPEPLFPGDSGLPPLSATPPPRWSPLPSLGPLENFSVLPVSEDQARADSLRVAATLPLASPELTERPKLQRRHVFSAAQALSSAPLATRNPAVAQTSALRAPRLSSPPQSRARHPLPAAKGSSHHQIPQASSGNPLPWSQKHGQLSAHTRTALRQLRAQIAPRVARVAAQSGQILARSSARLIASYRAAQIRLANKSAPQAFTSAAVRSAEKARTYLRNSAEAAKRLLSRCFPAAAWAASFRHDWRRLLADWNRWLKQPVNIRPPASRRRRSEPRVTDGPTSDVHGSRTPQIRSSSSAE